MPLYEYECDACGRRFEVIRKFSESELDACTLCGKGPVRRLMSSPAIQFKGTGWYVTDYAKSKSSAEPSSSSKSETKKTESGSTDSAPSKSDSAKSDSPGTTSTAPKSSSET